MIATAPSRPLRSLAIVGAGWVLLRATMIWSGVESASATAELAKPTPSVTRLAEAAERAAFTSVRSVGAPNTRPSASGSVLSRASHRVAAAKRIAIPVYAMAGSMTVDVRAQGETVPSSGPSMPIGVARPDNRIVSSHNRWSGSAWLLLRADGPVALGTGGELGGSQAGIRAHYDIGGMFSATARVSRPLARSQGGEASVGIAIREHGVGIVLERRIALDRGGRNAFSVTTYGGFSDVPIGHGLRLDGYAQGGMVGTDAFADGAVRIEHDVMTVARIRLSAGAGSWGGAQPGVTRVDVGPQLVARLPLDGQTVRVSAEWRERIAGNAAPPSGPSLTVGIDF